MRGPWGAGDRVSGGRRRPRPARVPFLRALRRAAEAEVKTAAERPEAAGPTRRGLLRAAAAAGLAAAVGGKGFGAAGSWAGGGKPPRVAVVGAGLAGLVAATELKAAGVPAVVYEAAERVGGRVLSAAGLAAPGVVSDLGGEFVDSGHRDLIRIARGLGMGLVDGDRDPDPALAAEAYFFAGSHHTEAEAVDAFRPFAARVAEDADAAGDSDAFRRNPDARRLDRLSVAEYLDGLGLAGGWLRALIDSAFAAEFGLDAGELSALCLVTMIGTDLSAGRFRLYGESDERYQIAGGAGRIPEALAARLGDRLRLGRRLLSVRPAGAGAGGGYRLAFAGPPGGGDEGDREVVADFVVLALPFSVLRGVELGVELPPLQRRAVAELGYGTNSKIVAGFGRRPWRDRGYRGPAFSDEAFQSCYDGSRLQTGPAGPAALTLFAGGRAGRAFGAGTAGDRLAALLPGLDRAFPGASASAGGRVGRYDWAAAPLSLGSYSCYKPGQYTTIAGAEGRPAGGLFFAGEHCNFDQGGFMDSAAASGRRAARALLAAAGLPPTRP